MKAEATGSNGGESQSRLARKRGRGADPEQTKSELVEAAYASLRTNGLGGTTARSIAALADCNQAAIYYHFGGINTLLVECLRRVSHRRLVAYQEAIGEVVDLVELVSIIERLYADDRDSGQLQVLTELAGGITSSPELAAGIAEVTEPWLDFVEGRIREAARLSPLAATMPAEDVADVLFSLVIGMELRNRIDQRQDRMDRVFGIARLAARLATGSNRTGH